MAKKKTFFDSLKANLQKFYKKKQKRIQSYLRRRPHRSFQRTRRRDLPKRAELPGNIVFTNHVVSFIRQNKRSFVTLLLLFLLTYTLSAGVASQSSYQVLTDSIRDIGPSIAGGEISKATETIVLFGVTMMGGLSAPLNEMQQVYVGFLFLFLWLTIIWLSRHRFNAIKVRVRDAIYNSGSPLVPTILITFLGVLQLVPAALAVIIYSALQGEGLIESGIVAMLSGIAGFLLVVLSAYWLTSTFFALIIVTVPGTYPMQAIKMAGDIVIGRRFQILLRLLWLVFCLIVLWVIVLIPMILIADLVPWEWLPIVPFTVQLLSATSFIFACVYIYILYRGMINESIIPAKK